MKSSSKNQGGKQSSGSSRQQVSSGKQQEAASGAGGQYGEGNYAATKQYNEGLKKHMEGHDIEKEARDAAPRDSSEEKEMLDAEREGKSRGRGGKESAGGQE